MTPITASERIGRTRERMAERLAQDIADGSYVNLGIGIPELVAKYVPDGREVVEARFFAPEGVPGQISALTRRRLAILAES